MARLIGPSEASRLAFTIVTTPGVTKGLLKSKSLRPATFYNDPDPTATPTVEMLAIGGLADIRTLAGAAVPDSTVTVDPYSSVPLIQFPDGPVGEEPDSLLMTLDGGPPQRVYAREDDRMDALRELARVAQLAAEAAQEAADAAQADAGARETPSGAQAKADAAQAAAISAAATDATTKASAAQSAAISAAATDATTKASAAQSAATSAAATDATTKAAAAQAAATSAAATDATTKANAAQAAAIALSAQRASNLSDLGSASTARTNLGLGSAATRAVGATSADVAAGDAPAAAQAAAISTAATDATTKANAAQAAAVQRSNHTGTQSADTLTDGSTNRLFTTPEKTKLSRFEVSETGDMTLTGYLIALGNIIDATHPKYGMATNKTASANATALQAAINDGAASGHLVYVPAGRYPLTSVTANQGLALAGDVADIRIQEKFGGSQYNLTNVTQGTWFISNVSTGVCFDVSPVPSRKVSLENFGIIGPGTGTSIGLRMDKAQKCRVKDVTVANFYNGFLIKDTYFSNYENVHIVGCYDGWILDGSNASTFTNMLLEVNQNTALWLKNSAVNKFVGGCTEVNFGTPILIDAASSVNTFHTVYFEDTLSSTWGNQDITNAFEIKAGCDFNGFYNCHWPGGGSTQTGLIRGNHNQVLYPQGPLRLDLASSGSGHYEGSFQFAPTYTANTAVNYIMDFSANKTVIPGDIFTAIGKTLYLGPSTSYNNWIRRSSTTGDTEINSSTAVINGLKNFQSPALAASGLTGAVASGRFVGGTTGGAPVTGTFAVRDYIISGDGNLYVCIAAGTPGTWTSIGTPPAIASLAANALTVGEVVPQRDEWTSNSIVTGNGTLALSYFTADKTEAINTVTVFSGATAAAATPTLARVGVYSVAGNGDLTLVASTANDTTMFATANTAYPGTLTTAFNKVVGQRYALAVLVVTGVAAPSFHGKQLQSTVPFHNLTRVSPAIIGRVTAQTDLPASVTAGSIVGWSARVAMQLS